MKMNTLEALLESTHEKVVRNMINTSSIVGHYSKKLLPPKQEDNWLSKILRNLCYYPSDIILDLFINPFASEAI